MNATEQLVRARAMVMSSPRLEPVSDVARKAIRWCRPLEKAIYLARVRESAGPDPVIVDTMGKVGTTAMVAAVPAATGRGSVHMHRMGGWFRWKDGGWQPRKSPAELGQFQREHPELRHASWRSEYVRSLIARSPADKKWDLATGVRDPVAQCLSHFFQVGEEAGYFDPDLASGAVDLDELAHSFAEFLVERVNNDWFVTELAPATDIDVYATAFDREAGFEIYESDKFRVLLVRFEDLRRVGPVALQGLLRTAEPVELPEANVGDQKDYADLYRRVRDGIAISGQLLDQIYGSRLARHFYSVAEIDGFRRRWEATRSLTGSVSFG